MRLALPLIAALIAGSVSVTAVQAAPFSTHDSSASSVVQVAAAKKKSTKAKTAKVKPSKKM